MKAVLGLLVAVCLGMSLAGGAKHFGKKAYAAGCKDMALEIVDVVLKTTGDIDYALALKGALFTECEEKASRYSIKELVNGSRD